MGLGDGTLVGTPDRAARRHLAVDPVHVHRALGRHREPAARAGRGRSSRRRRPRADLPRHHLAGNCAGGCHGRPHPPDRSLQDRRSAKCADRRRTGPRDGIDDAACLHRLAYAGPRRLGRNRLHPALRLDRDMRFLLQLRGPEIAKIPMTTADTRPLSRRLFEPRTISGQALVPKIATYAALLVWTFVALMPLYWVLITSFKLPIQVDAGPFY